MADIPGLLREWGFEEYIPKFEDKENIYQLFIFLFHGFTIKFTIKPWLSHDYHGKTMVFSWFCHNNHGFFMVLPQ